MESQPNLSPMLPPDTLAHIQKDAQDAYPILHSPEALAKQALYFKALGDPTRLKIVGLLLLSDICLCQLVEVLDIPTSTMTHHLQVLDRGGLIETHRAGKFTQYAIRESYRASLASALQGTTQTNDSVKG